VKGKPPRRKKSGFAYREAAKQKKIAKLQADAAELGMKVIDSRTSLPEDDDGSTEFEQLGQPPLDDSYTALDWVRKVQLMATHLAMTRPITDALRERFKWAKDLSAVLGMTHQREALESRVKQLEAKLKAAERQLGAVKKERGNAVPRPPTARGQRNRRGPRALPPDPPTNDTPPESDPA